METLVLLRRVAEVLDSLGVPYFVTGSMASSAYGEARTTNDIDVIARLGRQHVDSILAAFPPPEYYCSSAGTLVTYSSPEDVILKKLEFFREGGSEKHLRDIVGILKTQAGRIEVAYLAEWVARLGVADEWRLVQSRMPGGESAR